MQIADGQRMRLYCFVFVLLQLFALTGLAFAQNPGLPPDPPIPGIPGQEESLPPIRPMAIKENPDGVQIEGDGLWVSVTLKPFSFSVGRQQEDGPFLLSGEAGRFSGFAPIAYTRDHGFTWNRFYWGYRGFLSLCEPWIHSAEALRYWPEKDRVLFEVSTDASGHEHVLFVVGPFYLGAVRLAAAAPPGIAPLDRIGFTFVTPEGEHFAGFGERFNGVDQRGKCLECWSEEGSIEPGYLRCLFRNQSPEWALPGGEDASYAPIPFFLSSRGYGLLADAPEPTQFDMACRFPNLWRVQAESSHLSLVIFQGPTPAEALRQYTERSGRSLVPRPWIFGPWNQFLGYPQGDLLTVARLFREKDIPSSVSHEWTAILPVASYAGQEQAILQQNAAMHDLGYKNLAYIMPQVDKERNPVLWEEAARLGHLVRNPQGDPYVFIQALNLIGQNRYNVSMIDFAHNGADAWWGHRLKTLVGLGFDGTMYDLGEYVPPDARFADGNNGHYWHNPYNLIYLRSAFRFFQQLDDAPDDENAPDYVYFHRSGYAGCQRWAWAMWSGDPEADWSLSDGLPAQVCGGINAGISGIPFWGSDIGGFHAILVPAPDSELLKRWVAFGAFSGLMRDMTAEQIAGGKRIHVFDEPELTCIVRRYQKLRTQLVPYILNAAREAHATGLPVMRAAFFHFPEDPHCWDLTREYMFGPDFYVAPVVQQHARTRTVYLPLGQWIELWKQTQYDGTPEGGGVGGFRIGGTAIHGGREITVNAPIDEIPVFVRLGAVIPLADPTVDTWAPAHPPAEINVTTASEQSHLLHVWAFPSGHSTTTLSDGSLFEISVESEQMRLVRSKPNGWTCALPNAEVIAQIVWPAGRAAPTEVTGMTFVPNDDPLALQPGTWTWNEKRNALALHGAPSALDEPGIIIKHALGK